MTPMTTQLTEAGQKLADALAKVDIVYPYKDGRFYRYEDCDDDFTDKIATAAQILMTPEGGGGLREADETRRANYAEGRRQHWQHEAERLAWMVRHLGGDPEDTLTPTAALKTSVPGNDAGMREALDVINVREQAENYTLRSDTDYTPSEFEKELLEDFGLGLMERLYAALAALSPPTGSAGDDETGVRELKKGCCSAVSPCSWQKRFPSTLCSACDQAALAHQPPKAETPAGVGASRYELGHLNLSGDEAAQRLDKRVSRDRRGGCDPEYGLKIGTGMYEEICGVLRALSLAPAARAGDGVALADVAAERRRQIEAEGWTPEHDDEHSRGELAAAAGVYALVASGRFRDVAKSFWPWDFSWWKPCDPRRNLVKAGALILAEIERLDRAALTAAPAANGEGA